jgi:hypothetical protein
MVPIMSLWLPMIVSAVIVFVVSSIIHMATPWHKGDFKKIPNEDAALDALRPLNIPPGDYQAPRPGSMKEMGSPEFMAKREKGPVFIMTVFPGGPFSMAGNLIGWYLFAELVSFFTGYVTSVALPAGTEYLKVFQIAGTVAFMGYALGQIPQSIWYRKDWGTTLRSVIDGLIYGLMTGGTFGWLWPR